MLGLETELLVDFYTKEIRSLLEFPVPVWHSGITLQQSEDIEQIQKIALSILLNDYKLPYYVKCTLLNVVPLYLRRQDIVLNFSSMYVTHIVSQHSSTLQTQTKYWRLRKEPDKGTLAPWAFMHAVLCH